MSTAIEHKAADASTSSGTRPSAALAGRYVQATTVGALLITAFWPILTSMYGSWFDEHAYMEHGILVIPAAAYMVWTKRLRLMQIPRKPSFWGIPLLFWGATQATLGVVAHWTWVSRTAFLVSLVGCIVALFSLRMVRELAYPLCTLILMIAPPTFIYERLTLDLQLLASRLGETCLEVLGYAVIREGNILELVGMKLSVEEACSGIRSLVAIVFLCVLYDYYLVRSKLMRALILVFAVPTAILANAGRLVATGMASQRNRELIHGAAHEALGYISVVVAGIGCIVLHLVMLYIQRLWRSRHA